MAGNIKKLVLGFILLGAIGIAPRFLGIISLNMAVELAIGALFAVSLNLLLSYTGLLSFGHALFFGMGAYVMGISITYMDGITLIPAILMGSLAAGLTALIFTPLLVRVTGTAFSMLTMAFGQLMYVLCIKMRGITGGEDGLTLFDMPLLSVPGVFSLDMTDPATLYYTVMGVVLISIGCMWYFTKTPLGGVQAGIRDNAQRVEYLGFHVSASKAVIFIISGTFAGLAGCLAAIFQQVISVDGFLRINVSFMPIMAIMIGGLGHFLGPVIGTIFLMFLNQMAMRYTDKVELVFGIVFIMVVMYAPYGIHGLWVKARIYWGIFRHRKGALGKEERT
ncbi:MAG: branched-chain amino acid ABC transporter permease [Desulfatibacillum sp.]|nr:branched-chain amino acid ABC transporter permease [Desulfatibacillum sp.]